MALQLPDIDRIRPAHRTMNASRNWYIPKPKICWEAVLAVLLLVALWIGIFYFAASALDKEFQFQDNVKKACVTK